MPRANIIVTHHHRIVSWSLNHKTYYLIRCRSYSVWIVMTASFSFFLRWILPLLVHRYFQCKSFLFWLAWASKSFFTAGKIFIDKNSIHTRDIEFSRFQFFLALYMLFLVFLTMNLTTIQGHFLFWSVLGFPLSLCRTSIPSLLIVVSIFLRTCNTLSPTSALVSLYGIGIPCISKFCFRPYCSSSFSWESSLAFFPSRSLIPVSFLDPCFFSWVEQFLLWGDLCCFW